MSHFFAMLSRMKYINRWGLMRNTKAESLSEHSFETAVIAHALALIENRVFGGCVNAERAALLALFHDAGEILTGDLPSPIKYYSPQIRAAYREVEQQAAGRLLEHLPVWLRADYEPLLREKGEEIPFVKAADKLSALIKCLEEQRMGNRDFEGAESALRAAVSAMQLRAADYFAEHYLPSYLLTLDEQEARFPLP